MMRVALISEHASPLAVLGGVDSGGQNLYVEQLARLLSKRGFSVDVFTRRDSPELPPVAQLDGARVVHVQAGPAAFVPKEDMLPFMAEFTRRMLQHCLCFGGYDVMHANFFMSALVAADLKKALGTPFVVTFHALGRVRRLHQNGSDRFPPQRLAIEQRVIHEADAVIAECPQDRHDLLKMYDADPTTIRTIPCGFDPDEFRPMPKLEARRALGLNPDEWIILQLGRMVPRKGIDNAIEALARLHRHHGVRARLVVVGGESRDPDPRRTPELGRLQELAAAAGVAGAVTFVGSRRRDELRAYYAAADVFVTTPWYEPFGITPLEAMGCGTPVIGSAVGGIKSTVVDGETGFLVPAKDSAALAERLARLRRDPSLGAEMSRRALMRARSSFTWRRVASDVARLYADVAPALMPAPRLYAHAGQAYAGQPL
jgi:glycosyltransferase involved in cell wall biosynthesis